MPNPELTQQDIQTALRNISDKITSLTRDFLTDQEKKREWESNRVTLQHLQNIKAEVDKIMQTPEFGKYREDNKFLLQAISTDYERLGHFIKEHEAEMKSPRALSKKRQFEEGRNKSFNDIKKDIEEFLVKVKDGKAHLIVQKDFTAVEEQLNKLNLDVKVKMGLLGNLRLVKKHMGEVSSNKDEGAVNKRAR